MVEKLNKAILGTETELPKDKNKRADSVNEWK